MIPAKIEDVFIQLTTSYAGIIETIDAGNFVKTEINLQESIYKICPFLEGTLEALPLKESFLIEGMIIELQFEEFNVDVELFKSEKSISILIHNRTSVYKIVTQLNQNRNDLFFIKREIAEKNIELERLRKIADKANEDKSRFLAMISHEIRNPLNVILGYSEMISKEQINNNVKDYSELLSISGENLKVIVNDVLDLSRIEAGKLELVNLPTSIKGIVQNCIKNYALQNKNTAVKLQSLISDKVPETLLGDSVRINQILSNLLSNALKFTEKGTISLDVNMISEDEKYAKILFTISDSGRGMSRVQVSKIFEEYHQNKKSDYRFLGGAGLGLSIVKRLLKAMDGEITVDSELGKGTTFNIKIPFLKIGNTEILALKKEEEVTRKSLQGKRILVADDDIMNQTIVAHILKKENVKLTIVNDGLEALNALKDQFFDIVLLDIQMPNITGEQLILRKNDFNKANKAIPFLALTANTALEDIEQYQKLGFIDLVSKPYTALELVSKIRVNLK